MLKRKSLLAMTVALASTMAVAEEEGLYMAGGWNKFLYDSDRFVKDQNEFYFGGGYHYDLENAIELMANTANTSDRAGMGNELSTRLFSLNLVRRFTPMGESGFFGRLGGGYYAVTPDINGGHNERELGLKLGAGYDLHLNEKVAIQLATDVIYGTKTEMADFVPSIGLALFLGGEEPEPMMEEEPEPQQEEYSDSDGDGVIDAKDQCPNTPSGDEVDGKGCSIVKDSDNDGVADNKDACPDTPAGAKVDMKGCPEMLMEAVSIDLRVTFPNNSSVIPDSYRDEIAQVAKFMTQYPDTSAELAGHTDSAGSDKYNQMLSEKRAKAVMDYLVSEFGISASRLSSKGYGESQPIADNGTADGRAKNRRVTAKIKATKESMKMN